MFYYLAKRYNKFVHASAPLNKLTACLRINSLFWGKLIHLSKGIYNPFMCDLTLLTR